MQNQFFAATKADIRHGGPRAFYSPAGDFIKRCCNHFWNAEAYYATLAQNLVTAHFPVCKQVL